MTKKLFSILLALIMTLVLLTGCGGAPVSGNGQANEPQDTAAELSVDDLDGALVEDPDPDGVYTTKEDVALYLWIYGELPGNFMTKKEAKSLGWEGGSLEKYAPGMCIGGDYFGNHEGILPDDEEYHECDIDTLGADSRGAKRLVYSDDNIYYTEDHYKTFELVYGEG